MLFGPGEPLPEWVRSIAVNNEVEQEMRDLAAEWSRVTNEINPPMQGGVASLSVAGIRIRTSIYMPENMAALEDSDGNVRAMWIIRV